MACSSTVDKVVETKREIAVSYYDAGKFVEAAGQFRSILEHDPEDFDALVGLGNCEREIGNDLYTSATLHADGSKLKPDELKMAQQEVDKAVQHHELARAALMKALEIKRNDPQALYGLGQLYLNRASGTYRLFTQDEDQEVQKNFTAAVHYFERVVAVTPGSYGAQRSYGFALMGVGKRPEAKRSFESYLSRLLDMERQLNGLNPTAAGEKAVVEQQKLLVRKDIADTRGLIEQCDLPAPAVSLAALRDQGKRLLADGKWSEALPVLEDALSKIRALDVQWRAATPKSENSERQKGQEIDQLRADIGDLERSITDCRRRLR